MKLEALQHLRLRMIDREVDLRPGNTIDLPPTAAWKILGKVRGKVRLVVNPEADWLTLWQHVCDSSNGLEPHDPRLPSVLAAIEICNAAYALGNKDSFLMGVESILNAMKENPKGDF